MSDQFAVRLHIEQVEGGSYLATSAELPGLVAQGRTVQEAVEIAQDVARRLLESYREHDDPVPAALRRVGDTIDLDVPITA
jgi:predicted RNase H-like HicB family nuclease